MTEGAGLLDTWLSDAKARHEIQSAHIQCLAQAKHLDEAGFPGLDPTLKKVTAFTKKLKSIGAAVAPASLLPELEKLNVSKFLEEIAVNICEAKIKISDIPSLIEFCVKMCSIYREFPGVLVAGLRKHVPFKKSDVITNPSKLRVDLRLLADLVLHGVVGKEGTQLLGSALSYLTNTDKTEHVNVSILMPLCRSLFFDITGVVPRAQKRLMNERGMDDLIEFSSSVLKPDQKNLVINLFRTYLESLVEHVNNVRLEMNALHKSIKRQERTRGDASSNDRQKFDQLKNNYDRLLQSATELSECMGSEIPQMAEEPSDDEIEEVKKLDSALADGKLRLWPDLDTQVFYENLIDVRRLSRSPMDEDRDEADANSIVDEATFSKQEITESVNNVDLTNLENLDARSMADQSQEVDDGNEEDEAMDEENADDQADAVEDFSKLSEADLMSRGASATVKEFFAKLTVCINRSLMDNAAVEFITHFNKKSHRKRLVQHLLKPPLDRFDLLPFYARFLATIKPVLPDVTMQVAHELLRIFREYTRQPIELVKKGTKKGHGRTDEKVHVSNYISELVKFSVLPKAEALTCLRTLLVDLKQYKVDMLCSMIESMGLFLYRSPESFAKMTVIMQVLRNKSLKLKDPRQQILLDNAYFSVIPPDEQIAPHNRLPPVQEFLQMKIISTDNRLLFFRKINWDDDEIADFVLKLFSNPCRVRFDDLDRLASLVSALCDYQEWVGVRVVDEVLEFIRLFLEVNHPSLQQRGFSSIIYLGQLFNYNVCGTTLIIKVLYQLITFGLYKGEPADDLIIRVQRVRLVCELVNVVCEFFCKGGPKTKMDSFLIFFLRFHYENCEKWAELADELGEFPHDTEFMVKELLKTWRKVADFPATLAEANEAVSNLEKQYKTKVEEILQGIREQQDDEEKDEKRLNCIMEEDEEEEKENDDYDELTQQSEDANVNDLQLSESFGDEDAGENIRVRTQHKILPEDEDFLRDFDRMMSETMQATHVPLKGPMTDLEVPPLARQKFERRITFASDTPVLKSVDSSGNLSGERPSLLPPDDDNCALAGGHSSLAEKEAADRRALQMALMTRGKGNRTVLKAVRIESSETMHESWRRYQEARERERREMKQVTLAMNERIQHQQLQEDLVHPHHPTQSVQQPPPSAYFDGDPGGMTNLTAIPPGHNAPPMP